MALIDSQKFYRDLEKGELAPLYFLFGEEPYLLNQCVDRFKYAVLSEGAIDFNYSLFYASDADISSVRDAVETLPMMAPKRLVILKEAQELTDKEWGTLDSLITTPVESTVFVILASRVDKRKKQIRLMLETADCVEFKKPYDSQIPGWVKYIAGTLNLDIAEDAILLLSKLVGSHLTEIEGELRKLADFVGDRKRIEVSDVAQAVSRSKEENVFDFTRAIGESDRVRALEHLVHLLDQGQNEIGIVSLLARHIRMLLTVKRGTDQGLSGAKLAQFAQVPPYFLENYVMQSRLWTVKKLEQTMVVLAETDKALKSSPLSSHIWLENLVLKTCGTSQNANM
ncbi:MAG: DNA polymerase III subunit delta [Bdellovibrionaceae bacterium]|nr:DNA polymerase III subunit delta [Pseudobdellovibrionaceae bacterium]